MNKDLFPVTAGDYIENTISGGKQSENSWSFKSKEALIEYFNIDKTFRDKLDLSYPNDKRILTIHSSALSALLYFYEVSNLNPLFVKIKNEKIKEFYPFK